MITYYEEYTNNKINQTHFMPILAQCEKRGFFMGCCANLTKRKPKQPFSFSNSGYIWLAVVFGIKMSQICIFQSMQLVPLLGRNKTKHYFQVQLFLLTPEVTWIVIVVYCSAYSRYIVFVVIVVVVSLLPEKNREIQHSIFNL